MIDVELSIIAAMDPADLLLHLNATPEQMKLLSGVTLRPAPGEVAASFIGRVAHHLAQAADPVVRDYVQRATVGGTELRPPWRGAARRIFDSRVRTVLEALPQVHSAKEQAAANILCAVAYLCAAGIFTEMAAHATRSAPSC